MSGKALDLTGERYSKLLVLNRNYTYAEEHNLKSKNAVYWDCQCLCGEKLVSTTKRLRSGTTTQCKKCAYKERNKRNYEDLVGKRFNRLLVLEEDTTHEKGASRATYYKCLCDCGNIVSVRRDGLKNGDYQSCGCLHKEVAHKTAMKDLTGQRFGKLTVLEPDLEYREENNIKEQRIYWKCKCDCGNIRTVSSHSLQKHTVSSCGCSRVNSKGEEKIEEILKLNNIDYISQYNNNQMKLSSGRPPRFDFAIFKEGKLQFLIEYNGTQHYFYSGGGWNTEENFEKTQSRDEEKIEICKNLKIPLEIISYEEYAQLEQVISNLLEKYNIKE